MNDDFEKIIDGIRKTSLSDKSLFNFISGMTIFIASMILLNALTHFFRYLFS